MDEIGLQPLKTGYTNLREEGGRFIFSSQWTRCGVVGQEALMSSQSKSRRRRRPGDDDKVRAHLLASLADPVPFRFLPGCG